jgi:hypothetical protein
MMNIKKNAKLINECIEKIQDGRISKDQCLSDQPDHMDEILSALTIIENISGITISTTNQDHRFNKNRLLQKLPDRKQVVTKHLNHRYRLNNLKRRFSMSWVFIAATIISLLSGAGVVYASSDALPGDILYPVKIWTENAQLAIASDEMDVALYAQFTNDRITEVAQLIREGRLEDLDEASAGYLNRSQLLSQTMARIQIDNPDNAIKLRLELEEKLQEQERKMQTFVQGSGSEGVNADRVQEQVRQMLEFNTQLRQRFNEGGIAYETEPDGEKISEALSSDESILKGNESGANANNKEGMTVSANDETGDLNFELGGKGENGVYAKIKGQTFDCGIVDETANCSVLGAPQEGDGTLHDKESNKILFKFSYKFEKDLNHQWKSEKDENGAGGENDQGNGQNNNNNQNLDGGGKGN